MLDDDSRDVYGGQFTELRFARQRLSEYAEIFKTVCVDTASHTFPTRAKLEAMAAQVPADFLFGFKVTDDITLKKFPNVARFGHRAGRSTSISCGPTCLPLASCNPAIASVPACAGGTGHATGC